MLKRYLPNFFYLKHSSDTAIITNSKLRIKVGSFYVYTTNLKTKKNVVLILRYPIKTSLKNLRRVNDYTFYGGKNG